MAKKQKKIRFEYFHVMSKKEPSTNISVASIFESLLNMKKEPIKFPNGDQLSIIDIKYYNRYQYKETKETKSTQYPIWKLVITRARIDQPGIYNESNNTVYELALDENEYVSDNTVIIYDTKKNIIGMQRNINGISPTNFESIFNAMITDEDEKIRLQALVDSDAFYRAMNHTKHKAITLRFSDVNNVQPCSNKSVNSVLNSVRPMSSKCSRPVALEVTFKISGRSDETLQHDAFMDTLTTAVDYKNANEIDKLLVKGAMDDGSSVEEIDMITSVIRDWCSFSLDEDRYISSNKIFEKLLQKYSERRSSLPDFEIR